ncbi:alpha/beta hydrolase fold domain-containing protein [Novosphingobium bradum]|uniref:Alpha/beta hydrolase fold domain-containing protein n=1 Tax=Novosphingobium bradum TaxID=1737444 RepID=A0ABV7INA4_9SPHN
MPSDCPMAAATPHLPPERPGQPAPADLAQRRQGLAGAAAAGLWRTDPPAEAIDLGGVRALRFRPAGPSAATVLHFHGGGYRIGQPEQVAPFAAALARRCGVTVVCPAYRLAPEHPFPAAIVDARAAQQALVAAGERRLILSGDSAGGGIAAALAQLAARDPAPPLGLVLLSAWLDLTVTSPAYRANAASDPLFSEQSAREAAALYLQGAPATDPLASPLFAAATLFPPTLVSAGQGEVLADDACTFHAQLVTARVPARLRLVPGMEHVAVTRDMALAGAAETFAEIARFIASLGTATPGTASLGTD